MVRGLNAIFIPHLSSGDITIVQLKLNLAENKHRDVLVGSAYMLYNSTDPPPQREVKELRWPMLRKELLDLLLGCDAKLSPHRVGEHRHQPEAEEPP